MGFPSTQTWMELQSPLPISLQTASELAYVAVPPMYRNSTSESNVEFQTYCKLQETGLVIEVNCSDSIFQFIPDTPVRIHEGRVVCKRTITPSFCLTKTIDYGENRARDIAMYHVDILNAGAQGDVTCICDPQRLRLTNSCAPAVAHSVGIRSSTIEKPKPRHMSSHQRVPRTRTIRATSTGMIEFNFILKRG